jgi:protein-tyrosine phosphatase
VIRSHDLRLTLLAAATSIVVGIGADRPPPTALEAEAPAVLGARVDCATGDTCFVSWEAARFPLRIYAGPRPARIDRSKPVVVVPTGHEVAVANPEPTRPLYFELVARRAERGPIIGDRFLHLVGAPNSRDLGGYQALGVRRTTWGKLFRTDGLTGLTDADRIRLGALGLPETCPATEESALPVDDAALRAAAHAVTSATSLARDRAALLRLTDAPLPQWVQCTHFDDRSGWPAALVLATLGVRQETIVGDHLQGARFGLPPAPDRRYVDVAFATIKAEYKKFDRYLAKGLDLDRRTIQRLRQRFLSAS